MLRCRHLPLLVFTVFTCSVSVSSAETPVKIAWETDPIKAWKSMQDDGRPLLVYVTLDSCGHCVRMSHQTYRNPQVTSQIAESFIPLKMKNSHEWLRQFRLDIYPTTLVISPEPKLVGRMSGFVGPKEMGEKLSAAVGRSDPKDRLVSSPTKK